MDGIFDGILKTLSGVLGLTPEGVVLFLVVMSAVANLVSRIIPDDATGWKAVIRKIASVVGLYVSNRVTAGVSTADVSLAAVKTPSIAKKVESTDSLHSSDR